MSDKAFHDALRLRTPDESHRIRCPECGAVLCEYLSGVNVYQCRSCKWKGVVSRVGVSLVASFVTLRQGQSDRIDARRGERY